MKFTCNREELDKYLQHVGRVVAIRQTIPVLSNVLMETDGKFLRLSGTDLEIALSATIPVEIEQEGAFTVPAKVFQELVHQNPDEEITFHLIGNELVCKGAKVEARVAGIDPEEYPALPKVEEKERVSLPANKLIDILKQVMIACATDQARPVLTGVLMTFSDTGVVLAATDSFRLVEQVLAAPQKIEKQILLPARTIQEIVRIVPQFPEVDTIDMVLGEQQVIIKIGGMEIFSRLLGGQFPKYHAIIPTSFVAVADVPSSELQQALRLAGIFGTAGISNVLLEVDEGGTLTISSYGSQRGNAKNTLMAVVKDGFVPIKAAFNTRFLLDAVSATGSTYVQLRMSGPTSPLIISTEDATYTQLVMPIRLDS